MEKDNEDKQSEMSRNVKDIFTEKKMELRHTESIMMPSAQEKVEKEEKEDKKEQKKEEKKEEEKVVVIEEKPAVLESS